MTIPHLKNRVSLMVEMLKVKTSPSTLCRAFAIAANLQFVRIAENNLYGLPLKVKEM